MAALTIEITTSCINAAWFLGNRVVHGHVTQYNLIFLEFDKKLPHANMRSHGKKCDIALHSHIPHDTFMTNFSIKVLYNSTE